MKKLFLIFFASFALLFLFSGVAHAVSCLENTQTILPCGVSKNPDGTLFCPCELGHIFVMIGRIYDFAVWTIVLPIAGLMIMIGGILLLVSGGNPGLAGKAKNIITYSIIGVVLVFGSWLIIDAILKAIGYTPANPWNIFP